MIVVMAVAMGGYLLLRKRAERWQAIVSSPSSATARRLAPARPEPRAVAAAVFFIAPIISTAASALQKVPMPLLNWSTLFDKWSLDGARQMRSRSRASGRTLQYSLKLAAATVIDHARSCSCRRRCTCTSASQGPADRRVPDRAALRRAARSRWSPGVAAFYRAERPLVLQLRLRARPVLRGDGAAVHLPLDRRRASRRSTSERWSTRHAASAPAGPRRSGARLLPNLTSQPRLGVVPHRNRRARRVHDRPNAARSRHSRPSASSTSAASRRVASRWRCSPWSRTTVAARGCSRC